MSLLFMDGFDCYGSTSDLTTAPGWSASGGTIAPTGGRFGGAAIYCPSTFGGNSATLGVALGLNTDYFVGFSFKATALPPTAPQPLMALIDASGNLLMYLKVTPTGSIQVADAGNVNLGSPPVGVVSAASWSRIELKFNFGTSNATGSVEVQVNGATIATLSAQNFYRAGGATLLRFFNNSSNGYGHYFDDLVIYDTAGDTNNDWLGDIRIDTLKPSADTAQADWSPDSGSTGYARIDDPNSAPDGDTSYIQSATVGAKSEFDLTNIIGLSSGINAVQARVCSKKTDAGSRTYKAYLNSNSEVVDGATINPSTDYAWSFNGLFEKNPDGDVVWDDTALNDLKLGLELVS